MKAVITVVGKDTVGIIYRVSEKLFKYRLNILDINQSVVSEYFTMIMLVDISDIGEKFEQLCEEFDELGKELNQKIIVQHENVFNTMHQV